MARSSLSIITQILLLIIISSSLSAQSLSNKRVIHKSISFHGSKAKWKKLKGNFLIKLDDGEEVELKIDFPKGTVSWKEMTENKESIMGGFVGDSCLLELNGKPIAQEGSIGKLHLDCQSIKDRTYYWTYMYGLPFKLLDKEVNFVGNPELVTFLDKKYVRITVNYNLDQSKEYWQFYFDPNTYEFKAAQFFHPALHEDSEYILYTKVQTIGGMKLPTLHAWYMFNSKAFIGSEQLEVID